MIVDDGSTDGTRELLRLPSSRERKVVYHDRNRGKGAAVRTALEHASEEFAAILDADLEYRAADLADVLEPLVSARRTSCSERVRGRLNRRSASGT